MQKVLVVENEAIQSEALMELIRTVNKDLTVLQAETFPKAMVMSGNHKFDMVICDTSLNAIQLMCSLREKGDMVPFVMTTGSGSLSEAVSMTKQGATDYLPKPFNIDRLLKNVKEAIAIKIEKEAKELKPASPKQTQYQPYQIVGESNTVKELRSMVNRIGATNARVLILGPNGAGKELVARGLHRESSRKDKPFVEVNCAAIPNELIESELFGHEKGAFTSAIKTTIGRFEQANGGTLFLDEIGDMAMATQTKLLRALQEQKVTKVGGDKSISVDVRVIAATNKDLKTEIERGTFREDLYHRLSVIVMKVPSLNERIEDIPELAEKFLRESIDKNKTQEREFSPAALDSLKSYDWTGNIRELRNAVERLSILSNDKVIQPTDVQKLVLSNGAVRKVIVGVNDTPLFKEEAEQNMILEKG